MKNKIYRLIEWIFIAVAAYMLYQTITFIVADDMFNTVIMILGYLGSLECAGHANGKCQQ